MPRAERVRTRLAPEERREALLAAATDFIAEHGIDALTMEALAARAEVSKGLVYHYFANRAELLLALMERERSVYDRQAVDRGVGKMPLREWIATRTAVLLDAAEERGAVFIGLFNQRVIEHQVEEERRTRRDLAIRATARRLERELGLPSARAQILSTLLTGALTAGSDVVARELAPRQAVEAEYLALVDLVIAGLELEEFITGP